MNGRRIEEVTYSLIGVLGVATLYLFLEFGYILLQR